MVRHQSIRISLIVSLLASLTPCTARACEDATVRDAAFLEKERDRHFLCTVGEAGGERGKRIHEALERWRDASAPTLNVETVFLAIDDAEIGWTTYGLPSAPPTSPAVFLSGRHTQENRVFFVDFWDPEPNEVDLANLLTSPVREAIQRDIRDRFAVVLYAPGADDGSAKSMLESVVTGWKERGPLELSLQTLDRAKPEERLLVSFLGLKEDGPDWIGVLFGRGKLMTPLKGDAISEGELLAQLELLTTPCTCLRSPGEFGVDIPMTWDPAWDETIVQLPRVESDPDAVTLGRQPTVSLFYTLGGLLIIVLGASGLIFWRSGKKSL